MTELTKAGVVARRSLSDTELQVRMGWAFRARIARDAIKAATHDPRAHWWAVGVHATGRRSWLVNGSTRGVVWLDLEPLAPARTLGLPLRLRRLGISVEDPDQFAAAINRG